MNADARGLKKKELPLPLGEGWGEGLVRQARNNSQGFSPLSRRATSQFFNAVYAAKNS